MSAATAARAFSEGAASGRTLRHLELTVTRKLDGILQGAYQGLVLGPGSDAADGRRYEPGDDVRRIDWSLTARSDGVQVRDTTAERELETWLVVDGSASLDFGTASFEKRDLALAGVAAFGFLTADGGNRIGALVVDGDGTLVLPPRAGRDAVRTVLSRMLRRPAAGPGGPVLGGALRRIGHLARRRGVVVVLSDLLEPPDSWAPSLRALAARHDVIVVEVTDPREDELPAVGLLTLVDPETGRLREVQSSNPKLRARFEAAARERRASVSGRVRSTGAAHLTLSTDRDWATDVARFVVTRRRRR